MQKFAVKIDLSTFFEDERKNVLILVNPQWNSVEHLQHRVENIFDVQSVRFQTDDGYFLPPQESIEIVKFAHILKAFIPSEVLAEKRRKSRNKSKHEHEKTSFALEPVEKHMLDVNDINSMTKRKKRKFNVLENGNAFVSSTPNESKRSKGMDIGIEKRERTEEKVSVNGHKSLENIINHGQTQPVKQKSNFVEDGKLEKSSTKKKHKSHQQHIKKMCKTLLTPVDISNITPASYRNSSAHADQSEGDKSESITNEKHIQYNDAGEMIGNTSTAPETDTAPEQKVKINFHCDLLESRANTSRVFLLNTNNVPKGDASQAEHNSAANVEMQDLMNADCITEKSMAADRTNGNATTSHINSADQENSVADVRTQNDKEIADETQNKSIQENHSVAEKSNGSIFNKAISMTDIAQTSLEMTTDSHTIDDVHNKSANETEITENESVAHHTTNNSTQETFDETTDESNVIDLNETDENEDDDGEAIVTDVQNISNGNTSTSNGNYTVKKLLPFCTELTELPNVNDIVLFRVAHTKNSSISKFIAGSCQYVNKRIKNIKLCIIDDNGEMDRLSHRFNGNLDDSTDKKCINIKLADMIDPKVFKII